jgi:hypothetical protein
MQFQENETELFLFWHNELEDGVSKELYILKLIFSTRYRSVTENVIDLMTSICTEPDFQNRACIKMEVHDFIIIWSHTHIYTYTCTERGQTNWINVALNNHLIPKACEHLTILGMMQIISNCLLSWRITFCVKCVEYFKSVNLFLLCVRWSGLLANPLECVLKSAFPIKLWALKKWHVVG